MNSKMQQYIVDMKLFVSNTKMQCHFAALADDGTVDKGEQRNLRILDNAIDRFMKDLKKIK